MREGWYDAPGPSSRTAGAGIGVGSMLNSSKALPAPSTVVIALDLASLDGRSPSLPIQRTFRDRRIAAPMGKVVREVGAFDGRNVAMVSRS